MTLAAVLTGDLIDSTAVEAARVDHTMATLAEAAKVIAPETPSRFTRYRGDGWQIHLNRPGNALWAAVYLKAALKADPKCLDTRIAMGIGTVESLGAVGLAGANGAAFVASGRSLDGMIAGQTLSLAGEKTDGIQRSLLAFVANTISGWSREQAEVMKLKRDLFDLSQQDIANELDISRQAVGARLQAAGYGLIQQATTAFRNHYTTAEP